MDTDKSLKDIALLAARLTLGGTMAAHGAQKMFGAFDGPGIGGASKMMQSLGFRPGESFARANAAAELTSGSLIAIGALGPVGPAILLSVMLIAIETVHRPKGYFNSSGGFEMNAMYIAIALLLANEGYGSFSTDEAIGLRKKLRPMHGWLAFAGAVAGALFILGRRDTSSQQSQTSTNGEMRPSEPIAAKR